MSTRSKKFQRNTVEKNVKRYTSWKEKRRLKFMTECYFFYMNNVGAVAVLKCESVFPMSDFFLFLVRCLNLKFHIFFMFLLILYVEHIFYFYPFPSWSFSQHQHSIWKTLVLRAQHRSIRKLSFVNLKFIFITTLPSASKVCLSRHRISCTSTMTECWSV